MPNNEIRLHPDAIRQRAQSIKGCYEIAFSDEVKVISFIASSSNTKETSETDTQEQTTQQQLARVNIYYQTGTVGVCHVIHDEIREYFHKKASLDTVERILRNPENVREMTFSVMNLEKNSSTSTPLSSTSKPDEWKQKLELVDVGIAVLVAERDKLMDHAKFLEKKCVTTKGVQLETEEGSNEEEDDDDDDDLSLGVQQGKNFAYSLPDDTVAKVDEYLDCWEDVKCVSTNGQGTVVLYESGEWKFTQGIPRFLRNKLLNRAPNLPCPVYVSIGCENQYFISFSDGNFEWMGSDALRDILIKSKKDVRAISFGSNYDSFFIVYDDGSWQYDGSVPVGLENKLKERGERGDLTCVSLGPKGEWFLAASNGRRWWGGISEELNNAIAPIKDRISFMDFGVDGSFMVRYV